MGSNDRAGIAFQQPKTMKERLAIAEHCCGALEITMPVVVDTIDDRVGHAYSGMPDRLYVIDRGGRVAYKGGRGPFGFKPGEMEQALVMTLLDEETPKSLPAAGKDDSGPIRKDVVFGKGGDVELKLDLAQPSRGKGPFPLVVCVHGGGWQIGHRNTHHATIRRLAAHGYVAATVQYRLTPKYPFPAQIEDVKCAVRFLRANAKKYNLDPNRVGALGDSAGGHLSLLLGLMEPGDGMEGTGGNAGQPSKVQAVVNYYGPTDLRTWSATRFGDQLLKSATGRDGDGLLKDLLGTADRKDPKMKSASPITYIDAKDPPVLTFQGTADPLVPLQQAKELHAALRKAGVPEHLEIIENGSHGWGGKDKERSDRLMLAFFDKHLKGKK